MKKNPKNHPSEHGQSMVELALTITILMILLAGVIDMGRAFFTYMAMRDAAQNPAGGAGLTAGIGAGIGIGNIMNTMSILADTTIVYSMTELLTHHMLF